MHAYWCGTLFFFVKSSIKYHRESLRPSVPVCLCCFDLNSLNNKPFKSKSNQKFQLQIGNANLSLQHSDPYIWMPCAIEHLMWFILISIRFCSRISKAYVWIDIDVLMILLCKLIHFVCHAVMKIKWIEKSHKLTT